MNIYKNYHLLLFWMFLFDCHCAELDFSGFKESNIDFMKLLISDENNNKEVEKKQTNKVNIQLKPLPIKNEYDIEYVENKTATINNNELILAIKRSITQFGVNWMEVSKIIGNTSPNYCRIKWQFVIRRMFNYPVEENFLDYWATWETELLDNIIFGLSSNLSIEKIAEIARAARLNYFEHETHQFPFFRNNAIPKMLYGACSWSLEEDEKLVQLFDKHGPKWVILSRIMCRGVYDVKSRYNSIRRKVGGRRG